MDLQHDAVAECSFHARLLQIDGDLHHEDIQAIKFLCKDHLPKSKLSKVTSGHELFTSMETSKLITARDPWLLVEIFMTIGRLDLIDLLDVDETKLRNFSATGSISLYRHKLFEIAQDLTREDTKKMSYLADKISKAKREKILSSLELFNLLEETKLVTPEHLEKLVEYMTTLKRHDLVERINSLFRRDVDVTEETSHKPDAEAEKLTVRTSVSMPESFRLELSKELNKVPEDQLQLLWTHLGYTEGYLRRLDGNLTSHHREEKIGMMLACAPLLKGDMSTCLCKLIDAMRFSNLLTLSKQFVANFKDHLPQEYLIDVESHQLSSYNKNQQASTGHLDQERDSILPVYKMDANPRGICVIFNNQNFWTDGSENSEYLRERIGSSIDAEKLKNTFKRLHFEVSVIPDKSALGIIKEVDRVSSQLVKSEHDCFVCCVLTHGKNDQIYGSDGKLLPIMDLMAPFKATRCPHLAGKPKLFFMQACLGKDRQEGIAVEADTHMEEDGVVAEVVPNEADFLLGYATAPGYVSYRSKSQGSWYISVLTELLDKLANDYDILSILTKVNQEVGKKQDERDGRKYKQSPAPQYTLRKKVVFKRILTCS